MWPFGNHKIIVMSKIFFTHPPKTIFVLLGAVLLPEDVLSSTTLDSPCEMYH